MSSVLLWLRRGSGPIVLLVMTGFLMASMALRHDWILDADWGLRYAAAAVFVFCPFVAAAVAYDVARKVEPTLAELSKGASRGYVINLLPGVAVLLCASLASVFSWLAIWGVVAAQRGVGPRDPWVYVETVTVYAAAVAVGVVTGRLVKGVTAAVVAAGVTLMAGPLLAGRNVLTFQIPTSNGTMIGLDRSPTKAVLGLVLHAAILVGCLGASQLVGRGASRKWISASIVIPVVPAIILAAVVPETRDESVPTTSTIRCFGDAPSVCGPVYAAVLLTAAQRDLAGAETRLDGSGLALPDRYYAVRGSAGAEYADRGAHLSYDPSGLRDRHLTVGAIAEAMSTPRLCRAFFGSATAPEYLELVEVVRTWMDGALSGAEAVSPAPASVRNAYEKLRSCPLPARSGR